MDNRFKQHKGRFHELTTITTQKLTRNQARAIEQALIQKYGMGKNGGKLSNLINSISGKNKHQKQAVAWGQKWLKANGH